MRNYAKRFAAFFFVLTFVLCTLLCVSASAAEYTVTKTVDGTTTSESAGDSFTLWEAPALASGQFVGWTDGSALYRAGQSYTLTEDTAFEAVVLDIYMSEGASVRLNAENAGIRFTTNIGRDGYDFLEEVAASLTVGTLIVPTDYIPEGKLSLETPKVVNVPNGSGDSVGWMNISFTDYSYGGSLVNLLPNNYIRNFSGIGYVTVEYADGSSTTFYAPYDTANARSILTVACRAYDDVDKGYADWQKKIIKAYIDGVIKIDSLTGSVIPPESTEYEVTYRAVMDNGNLTISAKSGKERDASAVKCLVVDGKINKKWSLEGDGISAVVYNIDDADDFGEDIFDDIKIIHLLTRTPKLANYSVPYAPIAPTMDGKLDSIYTSCDAIYVGYPENSERKGDAGASAYFAHDGEYIYLFVEVSDTTVCPPAGTNGSSLSGYDGVNFFYNFSGVEGNVSSVGEKRG